MFLLTKYPHEIWHRVLATVQSPKKLLGPLYNIAATQTDRSKSRLRAFNTLLWYKKCICKGYYSFGAAKVKFLSCIVYKWIGLPPTWC